MAESEGEAGSAHLSAMRRKALLISWSVALRPTPSTSYGSLLCAAVAAGSPFSDLNDPNLDPAMSASSSAGTLSLPALHSNSNSSSRSRVALGSRAERWGAAVAAACGAGAVGAGGSPPPHPRRGEDLRPSWLARVAAEAEAEAEWKASGSRARAAVA